MARRVGIEVLETGPFTARDEEVPGIGDSRDIKRAALSLTEDNPTPRSTYKVDGKYYVLYLKDRNEPSPDDYAAERDVRKIEALNARRDAAWEQFVRNVKTGAEIVLENPPADLLPRG